MVTLPEIIIIGGGVVGVAAAARMAPFARVTLLESEAHLGYHASGRSAALYEPNYGAPAVVALSKASGAYFHSIPHLLRPRGLMLLGGAQEGDQFYAECADLNLDPIDMAQAQAIFPILNRMAVQYAAYATHAYDIDTNLLMAGFAKQARGMGAQIVTDARVTGLDRMGGPNAPHSWQARTKQGVFGADLVVNAAGPWADQVARMAGLAPLGLMPLRRSMARIPAPVGMDVSQWPMVFGTQESWYMKPDAGALIVSPAEEHPMPPHDAFADDMTLAEGLARYQAMVSAPIPRLLSSWAGLRTFAPDRVPVIGPDPAAPSFFWAAGLGGYGFQTADAASRLLAGLVLGQRPEFDTALIAALSLARFS